MLYAAASHSGEYFKSGYYGLLQLPHAHKYDKAELRLRFPMTPRMPTSTATSFKMFRIAFILVLRCTDVYLIGKWHTPGLPP